ncbi:MAG: hypothetical protein NTV30_08870, partial [Chloroflexi bacterium]|nr:hypothetical protein [Chloroflexota bacterium]
MRYKKIKDFNKIFDRHFFQNRNKSEFFDFFSWRRRKKIYSVIIKLTPLALISLILVLNLGSSNAATLTLPDADISAGYSEYNNISLGANNNSISLQAGNLGSWNNEDSPLD